MSRGCAHNPLVSDPIRQAAQQVFTPGGSTESPFMSYRAMIYYAWSRLGETTAPLEVIENRFPALFEGRRMLYPRFAEFADSARYDQGIGGFLDHFQRPGFVAFADLAGTLTGLPVAEIERADAAGVQTP